MFFIQFIDPENIGVDMSTKTGYIVKIRFLWRPFWKMAGNKIVALMQGSGGALDKLSPMDNCTNATGQWMHFSLF